MGQSQIDPLNSFQGPLGAGASFTGEWRDIKNEGNVTLLFSGEAAAPGSLFVEFTIDQVVVDSSEEIEILDISASQPVVRLVAGSFFRVRYVNGATPLTTFRFETQLNKGKNVGFTLDDFAETLEGIELNTAVTANMTNVRSLAFAEIDPVPANTETTIVSYTAPATKAVWITRISISGQENSRWKLRETLVVKDIRRIGAGDINGYFEFGDPGLKIDAGVTVDVRAYHEATGRSPAMNATIYGYEEVTA